MFFHCQRSLVENVRKDEGHQERGEGTPDAYIQVYYMAPNMVKS